MRSTVYSSRIAIDELPAFSKKLEEQNVEIYADQKSFKTMAKIYP
jgi:hypothetical protein